MVRLLRVLVRLLLLGLVALVLLRTTGLEQGGPLLLMGALPLLLPLALPVLLYGLLRRHRVVAAVSAGLLLAELLVVRPALEPQPLDPAAPGAPRLRVAVANLYVLNPDPRATGAALRALDLDVLVVPELTAPGLVGLRASGLLADLPHAVVADDARRETVGLLSRLPLRDVDLRRGAGRALPRATVVVGGAPVRLLSTHTLPPVWLLQREWRAALRDLAQEARDEELPVVVVGDLNGDRDHGAVRALLREGLRDAHDERGRGLARTYPASVPLLHLDHVLVGDGPAGRLAVLDVTEVRLPGTDHRGVVAGLAVLG